MENPGTGRFRTEGIRSITGRGYLLDNPLTYLRELSQRSCLCIDMEPLFFKTLSPDSFYVFPDMVASDYKKWYKGHVFRFRMLQGSREIVYPGYPSIVETKKFPCVSDSILPS